MLKTWIQACSLARHISLAITLSVLAGAGVACVSPGDAAPHILARVGLGAALGAATGLALALLQALIWGPLVLFLRRLELGDWWAQVQTREPGSPREPGLRFRASVGAGLLATFGFALAVWLVIPRIVDIAEPGFARSFAVVLLGTAAAGAALGALVLARILIPLIAALDRRLPLPWPPAPALRYLLLVSLPLGAAVSGYAYTNAEALGTFALPLWLLLAFLLQGQLALAWPSPSEARRFPTHTLAAAGLALLAILFAHLGMTRSESLARWAKAHPALAVSVSLVSTASDFDRDGFSSLFGGRDCAPFDGARSPKATDTPGNGIDEDCSGADMVISEGSELERFHGGYTPPESKKSPDIIFVIVDAVRFDELGFGGADPSPSPYLDEAAEDSLVFTRAYSNSSATMLSIPSMLTGRAPGELQWQPAKRIEITQAERTLGPRLAEQGYRTLLVGESYMREFLSRLHPEYERHRFTKVTKRAAVSEPGGDYFSGRAAPGVIEVIRYLEAKKQPVFATLYIPDPHSAYATHGFGLSHFGDSKRGLYRGELANSDHALGFLIHYLKHTKQWDNTILVVVADHGEEFDEHGGVQHSRTCYIESVHVPLLLHAPGLAAQTIDAPVSLLDIAPTILELVGAPEQLAEGMSGQSLLIPALAPERVPPDRVHTCAVISQRARQGNFFRRAARGPNYVLIHNVLEGRYELYDSVEDPQEEHDIYAQLADDLEVAALRERLTETLTGNLPSVLLTD